MSAVKEQDIRRFMRLFIGNARSFGRWYPEKPGEVVKGRNDTAKEAYTAAHVKLHLEGKVGLGLVPIMDTAACHFAALDIDNHGEGADIDIVAIAAAIEKNSLPLVACRSKSGGVHCYLFMQNPVAAKVVREHLRRWAKVLGLKPDTEVFPKQDQLVDEQCGNYINLPYFGNDATNRYAVAPDGTRLTLDEFIEAAETKAVKYALTEGVIDVEHSNAPPCVQRLIKEGIPTGHRNQGVYAITVYMRKAYPQDFAQRVRDAVASMPNPLEKGEADKTIRSAGRRDYRYKCSEEPCVSRCDRQTCVTRSFGITQEESRDMGKAHEAVGKFEKLIKYIGTPTSWGVDYDGVRLVGIRTQDLWSYHRVRDLAAEQMNVVIPPVNERDWRAMIEKLMDAGPEEIIIPDDATVPGLVRVRLQEFIGKASYINGHDVMDAGALLRGAPIQTYIGGQKVTVFRGPDFIKYLRHTKSDEMRGKDLWLALEQVGIFASEVQAGGQNVTVWCVPIDAQGSAKLEGPDVSPEY